MRKLSLVFAAAVLFTAGNVFANDSKKADPSKSLTEQITELLKDNVFDLNNQELTAKVLFTLNHNKEIVVISVETEDEILEGFVKSKLNYQEVALNDFHEGKLYTVPVRIRE